MIPGKSIQSKNLSFIQSTSRLDKPTIAELRSTLAERESALSNARGYATELQQLYRDTLSACESAEARLRDLEAQLHPASANAPPLVIVSPPPLKVAPTPFLAQPRPTSRISPEDAAIVAGLLTTIERLRGERDTLRRDLQFANVEHRVADDALRARLVATEREVHRLEKVASTSKESEGQRSSEDVDELRRLHHELEAWRNKFEQTDAELAERTAELASNDTEMDIMRVHVREVEESKERAISSCSRSSRIAISSLIVIQHLNSELDQAEDRLVKENHTGDEVPLIQETLRAELAASNARFADAIQEVDRRDVEITDMHSRLSQFQLQVADLERELSEAHEGQVAAELQHSMQQPSPFSSDGSSTAEALRSQLEELEQRVLRRTEQIGMLQHDSKRLETNLRVAEETIGELIAELETLKQERACLVEDCAQAREARDEAHRRIDELELELETLFDHRDELEDTKAALRNAEAEVIEGATSLEGMVRVLVESVARSRSLHSALKRTRGQLATTETNVTLAVDRHSHSLAEIDHLSSQIDSMTLTIHKGTADMDALKQELDSAKQETERLSNAFKTLNSEVQSREQDITDDTKQHAAIVEELEGRLASAEASRNDISRVLEVAQQKEKEIQAKLERVHDESQLAIKEVQTLTSTVASLEQELSQERASHSETFTRAQQNFEMETSALEARIEESQGQYLSFQAEHANVVQELTRKLEETKSHLANALEGMTSRESLESELRRLEAEHAEELLLLRSRLEESIGQAEVLQAEIQTTTETIKDLESEIEATVGRYEAAQVEIHGLEHVLAAARTHVDEHDASIQALQREKTALQIEHTRLEAELDRLATKHQYVEQQAKRR